MSLDFVAYIPPTIYAEKILQDPYNDALNNDSSMTLVKWTLEVASLRKIGTFLRKCALAGHVLWPMLVHYVKRWEC